MKTELQINAFKVPGLLSTRINLADARPQQRRRNGDA